MYSYLYQREHIVAGTKCSYDRQKMNLTQKETSAAVHELSVMNEHLPRPLKKKIKNVVTAHQIVTLPNFMDQTSAAV